MRMRIIRRFDLEHMVLQFVAVSLMVEANERAVTACTVIRATICLSKLPYTPA